MSFASGDESLEQATPARATAVMMRRSIQGLTEQVGFRPEKDVLKDRTKHTTHPNKNRSKV